MLNGLTFVYPIQFDSVSWQNDQSLATSRE